MNKIERELQLSSLEKGLREKFTTLIVNSFVLNKRELHLEVSGEEIRSIASHINVPLDCALISMIGTDQQNQAKGYGIDYVFASRKTDILIVVHTIIDPSNPSFISIADLVHASTLYEREIHDLFGLIPVGHPDAKPLVFHGNWPKENYPLRKDYPANEHPDFENGESIFRTILGEGVYEIPVGPVHAGIIEPGHFRFSLAGEPIQNLEAQLYYTHKGIEKLAEGMSIQRGFYLSERISGG